MLNLHFPKLVKQIFGFIYSDEDSYLKSLEILRGIYGPSDYESQKLKFSYTDYYAPEMGSPLYRRFVSFLKLQEANNFVNIKLTAIEVEKQFLVAGNRLVNIDPGYINDAKLVLTTTKDFAHRIYLDKGVYAEVTLCYRNGMFRHLETTFPDYRTCDYQDIFLSIRNLYRGQLT
ncbi:MAG: DUF4416 family protein [Candidatus Omnitrophica bacterium]|nr:DUF4416 family protein [Candidatus Omnitrophota bacterium]